MSWFDRPGRASTSSGGSTNSSRGPNSPTWRLPTFGRPGVASNRTSSLARYAEPASPPSIVRSEERSASLSLRPPARGHSTSLSLVKALSGSPRDRFDALHGDGDHEGSAGSGKSTPRSSCSTGSNTSTRTPNTMTPRTGSMSSGGSSSTNSRRNSKSIFFSFEECSIDIEHEQGATAGSGSLTVVKDFEEVFMRENCQQNADGILQCIKLYGFDQPLKLQQHAIPAIMNAFGSSGGPAAFNKGKSCVIIQGPPRIGKTSSLALSLLASVDTSIPHLQAIVLTTSNRRDFDKYFNILTLMHPVTSQSFMGPSPEASEDGGERSGVHRGDADSSSSEWSERRDLVEAASNAQILVGHPSRLLKLISSLTSLRLDFVRLLAIDDVEELIYNVSNLEKDDPLPASSRPASEVDFGSSASSSISSPWSLPQSDRPPRPAEGLSSKQRVHNTRIDEVIQICNVIECRQYGGHHMDSVTYSSGNMVPKLRYVIMSQQVTDQKSRKVLRLLKNSLMKKKNLLSPEISTLSPAFMRKLQHYYVEAPRTEWVRILAALVHSLSFPRAIVFADDRRCDRLEGFLQEMQTQNLSVSANVQNTVHNRRLAVQEFAAGKTQFLFVTSDPALCQIVLPKVSCIFHFDVPSDMLSVYGVRLLPLDARQPLDAVSVLFSEHGVSTKVQELEKLFNIQFMDMPFEFILPSSLPGSPMGESPRSQPNTPLRKRVGGSHSKR